MHALSLEIGSRTNLNQAKECSIKKEIVMYVLQKIVLHWSVCSTKQLVEQSFCWMEIVLLNKTIDLNCRTN